MNCTVDLVYFMFPSTLFCSIRTLNTDANLNTNPQHIVSIYLYTYKTFP